jgi:hypothetical protein
MLRGTMNSEPLQTLGLWAAVALAAGLFLLWRGWMARRRRQRLAHWRELCLRLELTPEPGEGRAASGRLQGLDFLLRDTGSALLLEVPLPGRLLPPGVLVLSARARGLRPRPRPRPLRVRAPVQRPGAPAWFTERRLPLSKAEPSLALLEAAHHAAQAFAPLRVESQRLVRALPGAALASLNDVRDAVRALHAAGQHWLDTVEAEGLPRVEALPEVPSPGSLLRGVLGNRDLRLWLLVLNGGISLTLAALWLEWSWVYFGLMGLGVLLFIRVPRLQGRRAVVFGLLAVMSTFAAPALLIPGLGKGTSPSVLSVRDITRPEHRQAKHFRFDDAELRVDLQSWDAPSFVPVLPADWRPGDLVPAWAVAWSRDAALSGPLGGIARAPTNADRRTAIALALERGLTIHAHAVYLDMRVHPDEVVARGRLLALLCWGFPNALWLGVVLLRWRRAVRESRRVLDA